MARVTVEDCLKNVKNRFELVILSAKRARQLMHGKEPMVEWDNDKPTVVALREIAAGFTNFDAPVAHEEVAELRIHTETPVAAIVVAEEVTEIEETEETEEQEKPQQPEAPEQSDASSSNQE